MPLPASGLLAYPSKGNYFDDAAQSVNSRYNRGLRGGFKGSNVFEDGLAPSGVLAGYEMVDGNLVDLSAKNSTRGTAQVVFPRVGLWGTVGYRNRSDKTT